MDKIKLFLDEDVHTALSTILRKRGFDVLHAQEAKRKGKTDLEQMEFAVHEQRCLLSFNVKDFVLLHNKYVQQGKDHCGIILSKHLPIGELLRRVLNLLQHHSSNSIKNQIIFLSKEIS